ncbi:MAG: PAS domain S-box protein [Candidatus Hydrogenedentes bacterium]|nr:PAS domain S-box protein [Candidatus Hydrogenedentota bacterium]
MNLLGKFTLALLACGLAPLLLGTLFTHTITKRALEHSGQQARDALEEKAKEHVTALVRSEGEHLKTFIRSITNETQILSRTGRLGFLLRSKAFYTYVNALGPAYVPDGARKRLRNFYQENIASSHNPSKKQPTNVLPPTLAAHIAALDPNAVAVQLRYFGVSPKGGTRSLSKGRPVEYDEIHRQLDNFWPAAMSHLGYRDMLLVDGERGDIVYSASRGIDFGASLLRGPLANTKAAQAYRKVWESDDTHLVFEDVTSYMPVYDMPVCFVGAPVYEQGKKVGVALFVLGLNRFDAVLNTSAPLEDGSTMYLVGPDYRPRSNVEELQALNPDPDSEPDLTRLDIEPARVVFHLGEMGSGIYTGPSGQTAFIAFAPVDILGVTWALIAQVDTEVAFAAVRGIEESSAFFINRMLYLSDFIVIAAILVLCFVADFLAKPIVRPLRSTVKILKGMVQGEDALNQRLVVRGKDEVAELASSFNQFMDKLQMLYGSLEKEIADRQAAQKEVERSQQYYKALIENAPDVIVVLDAQRQPLFVSPAFERTFGYAPEEVLGSTLLGLIHPDDLERLQSTVATALDEPEKLTRIEYRIRHKDGHWVDVASVGTNHTDNSNIAGVVINMRDITRRKEADRILREYSTTLERDVALRTIELQQNRDELAHTIEELRTTQDRLVLNEKMASLGALTAGIAHEIKNPLNFVTNFAELTAELAEELGEEIEPLIAHVEPDIRDNLNELLRDIRQNSQKIEAHGKRADSIVKAMLLHSRGQKDERQSTDINVLLEEYVHLSYHGMRALDSSFNIELDLNFSPDLPELDVVPQDLARVFLNILNNGCYASHQRKKEEGHGFHPVLTVSTELKDGKVMIRIRDNGEGIPKDILDKIFTPFFTTKPAGAGTGLGLSISYDIVVQEHHGELRVESEPGEYTEFQITLPIVVSRKEAAS